MARNWRKISVEEARQNPLYGVKNWLAVFAFGVLMVPLREIGELSSAAHSAGVGVSEMLASNDAWATYAKVVMAFETLMAASIFWLLFTKHRSFRPVASGFLLASWPMFVAMAFATQPPGAEGALATIFFPWIVSCAVWVTYLQRSRRVRVTFENSILDMPNRLLSPAPIVRLQTPESSSIGEHRQPTHLQSDKASADPLSPAATQLAATSALPSQSDMEEHFWSQAHKEFEGASRRQGLWARVFAEADGNEGLAKARYLRERSRQIADEERQHQEGQAAKVAKAMQAEAEEKARIGKIRGEFVSGATLPLEHIGDLVGAVAVDPSFLTLADRTHGRTLLHWCAKYDLTREALLLVERGADANAADGKGRRPHELAENLELRGLLRTAAIARKATAAPRQL